MFFKKKIGYLGGFFSLGLVLINMVAALPLSSQPSPIWQKLPNAPVEPGGRHEDGWFINANKGWIVNSKGEIWHTPDGGFSWTQQIKLPGIYLRCVTFADSLKGWAGSIGFGSPGDTLALYATHDGGQNWAPVSTISGPKPPGLCGIWAYDSLHIYATGRFDGPSYFMASNDGGKTWLSQDMNDYAANLIDCYFFAKDSGIVVGQTGFFPDNAAIILFTPDGGRTWQTRYTSKTKSVHPWKIHFANKDTGFVSLQGYTDSVTYLKTEDRGATWQEFAFKTQRAFSAQGIAFIGSHTGWIGPHPQSARSRYVYQTLDNGQTWQEVTFGRNINRFRMLNDTLGYAVGETIYKYTSRNLSHIETPDQYPLPVTYLFADTYPNPFNATTTFRIELPQADDITITIYDVTGRIVDSKKYAFRSAGKHRLPYNAHNLASGMYVYHVSAGSLYAVGKMVVIK